MLILAFFLFFFFFYRKVELVNSEDGSASLFVAPPVKNASVPTRTRQHCNNLQKSNSIIPIIQNNSTDLFHFVNLVPTSFFCFNLVFYGFLILSHSFKLPVQSVFTAYNLYIC